MQPVKVPDVIKDLYPNREVVSVGPPSGFADEDCGTIEALININSSRTAFDGSPEFRVYWKPNDRDIGIISRGGVVELIMITDQLVPHSVSTLFIPTTTEENDGSTEKES